MSDLRIFVVCYSNGNFHSMTADQDIAYSTAHRIDGIIGELTNVHRPKYLHEVMPPKLATQIESFLENPTGGVRRGRPQPKPDIEDDRSAEALDQAEAA